MQVAQRNILLKAARATVRNLMSIFLNVPILSTIFAKLRFWRLYSVFLGICRKGFLAAFVTSWFAILGFEIYQQVLQWSLAAIDLNEMSPHYDNLYHLFQQPVAGVLFFSLLQGLWIGLKAPNQRWFGQPFWSESHDAWYEDLQRRLKREVVAEIRTNI